MISHKLLGAKLFNHLRYFKCNLSEQIPACKNMQRTSSGKNNEISIWQIINVTSNWHKLSHVGTAYSNTLLGFSPV